MGHYWREMASDEELERHEERIQRTIMLEKRVYQILVHPSMTANDKKACKKLAQAIVALLR